MYGIEIYSTQSAAWMRECQGVDWRPMTWPTLDAAEKRADIIRRDEGRLARIIDLA